jgi:hypothetical protein
LKGEITSSQSYQECVQLGIEGIHVCIYIHEYTTIDADFFVKYLTLNIYMYMYIYMNIYTYIHAYIHIYIYIYICVYINTFVYTYIYIYVSKYI